MASKYILSAGALVLLTFGYLFFYEPSYRGQVEVTGWPFVFGRGGLGTEAPDHSLVGTKLAIREGLNGVELTGQRSSDGQWVIFPDETLDRLTSGTGPVGSKTFSDLRGYNLARKYRPSNIEYAKRFSDLPASFVDGFAEFLREIHAKGILILNLTPPTERMVGIETEVAELLRKYGAFEEVFVSSFSPLFLYRLKSLEPRIRTVLKFTDAATWPGGRKAPFFLRYEPFRRAIRKFTKPDVLSADLDVAPTTLERLIAANFPVIVWNTSTAEEIERALRLKPYGVISDEPLVAHTARDRNFGRK